MSLGELFEPSKILFIGSSKTKEDGIMVSPEIFERTTTNLKEFSGEVFVYDISDIKENGKPLPKCDVVLISLPPSEILEIASYLETKFLIILSGGFNEEQKNKLKIFSKKFRIIGPNSVCGLINTKNKLNTTFEKNLKFKKGKISIISQSGGIGANLLDHMISNDIGFSKFVWIGNSLDLNECDFLEYFLNDKETKVILIYVETLREARRFMSLAKNSKKPIIVLKTGRSKESKERALTHTDSLSTSFEIYSSAFKQMNLIDVESVRELFNCGLFFERYRKRKVKRVAIVSNTGGSAILAADWCEKEGLELSQFSEKTKRKIKILFPKIKVLNPIDISADSDGEKYKIITNTVIKDKNVDALLLIIQFKSCLINPEELEKLKRIKTGKIVVACVPGEDDYKKAKFFLRDTFPLYNSIEDAVKVLKKVESYGIKFNKPI